MSAKHQCIGCRFATWETTKSGKLHPNGYGKCTWGARIPVAVSHESLGFIDAGTAGMWKKGRTINRQSHHAPCPVREEAQALQLADRG